MAFTYLLQFGGAVLPSTLAPISADQTRDLAVQERPRVAGAIVQAARPKSRKLVVSGAILGGGGFMAGFAAIQSQVDALRATIESQTGNQPLYFGRSDRYIYAQLDSITEAYQRGDTSVYGSAVWLTLNFTASDPYFWDTAGTVNDALAATGGTVTTGGNAPSYALWTIPITTGGTGTITLTNATTGESATISGAFANGDSIALNRGAGVYNVAVNGFANPSIMTGVIPMLWAGANVVTIAASGLTLGAPSAAFTNRWLSS